MKTVVKSANEDKSICQIEFGILSSEDIIQQSHVKIFNNGIYDIQQKPIENGLMDPRMGPADRSECTVCKKDQKSCIGHYGYITLSNYLFPFGYLKDIVKILKCICKNCGRLLLKETDKEYFSKIVSKQNMSYITKKSIRLQIIKQCIKIRTCRFCNNSNGNVKKVKSLSMIYHQQYILKEKLKEFTGKNENFSSDLRNLMNCGVDLLRPNHVFQLFKHIPEKDFKFLGLTSKTCAKISNLIFKHIPVPPNCIRPSTLSDNVYQSREDDITILLRMQVGGNKIDDMHNEYARMINPNASCIRSAKDRKFIRGMVQRLAGKKGRFRGNIMGKRTNFTSRTVISPDPNLKIDEVGIPKYCAMRLTYTERVTASNLKNLKSLVLAGPHQHPGAVGYAPGPNDVSQQPMSHLKLMMTTDIRWQNLHKESWRLAASRKIKIGDYVERFIENGDIVLFNRQPSLHRLSIQSFRVVVKDQKTFSFNSCCCNPFNADYDGDEMNVHFPQTYEARAEAQELMSSIKNITSPNSGEPLTSPLQDILTAAYLLTSRDSFYSASEFFQLAGPVLSALGRDAIVRLPKPAILHPVPLYTGKQLMALIMSPDAHASNQFVPAARINLAVETRPHSQGLLTPDDSFVLINNSELLIGQLTKKLLGGGSKSSIFFRLLRDVGDSASCRAMERLCRVALIDLKRRGFSIGIRDVAPSVSLRRSHRDLVNEHFSQCDQLIDEYETGRLASDPGCSAEETLEARVSSTLSKIRDEGGKQCRVQLPGRNAALIMAQCGSKGSLINISQMVFCVGQQIIDGKRIMPVRGTRRTLLSFLVDCRSPMSRGFVANSFYSGLSPEEFMFHAMSGREGLIDTAVKTAETGYLQRRLIKCLEDLAVRYDNTVRDFAGNLVQFRYGSDGFDPARLETTESPCDFARELQHELHNTLNDIGDKRDYQLTNHNQVLTCLNALLANRSDRFSGLKESLIDTVSKYMYSAVGVRFGIRQSQLAGFVANCFSKFERALIEPGTAIGVICGQSVGEPATQMTLKTFHFAGVASMNITQGVPRMQEILNAVAKIRTPIVTVSLERERDEALARAVQTAIQPVLLSELYTCSYKLYCTTGVFFYMQLDASKIDRLGVRRDRIERALETRLKMRNQFVSLVTKDDGQLYVEVFSEDNINCQLALGLVGQVQVAGLNGVRRTVIQRGETGAFRVFVEGGRLADIFQVSGVDATRTYSNNILEMIEVLGIEAARATIINEFNAVMGAHNLSPDIRHVMLLADTMCNTGQVCGYQRSGMSKSKNSVLCLASFERTLDHLQEAAFHNQKDKLHGISDCLTFGKTIPLGTGMHKILMNDQDNQNKKELKRRGFLKVGEKMALQ